MQNFFGSKLNSVLLLILIVLMVFALHIMLKDKATYLPVLEQKAPVVKGIEGKTEDLISFSIVPGAVMPSGILSYRGSIKGGWFFEGNIIINILDANKKLLKASNAIAKGEWMTSGPVDFEGNIDFTGLPKGPAYFEIHNDNASDLPENDKFIQIPIVIK